MKRFTILISLLFVLFSCGCGNSFTSPKEVTFAFIEESSMVKQTASVVSILSSGRVYTGSDSYSTTRVLSGVILNEEGYILTSSEACNFDVSDNGTIYEGKFTNAYAVLSDVYQDQHHYMLNLVDNREEAGLALFLLQTDFYYKIRQGNARADFNIPPFSPHANRRQGYSAMPLEILWQKFLQTMLFFIPRSTTCISA